MKKLVVIIYLLCLVACGGATPTPVDPVDPVDPDPISDTLCGRACLSYEALGCDEALDTNEGHSCVEVCSNLLDSDIPGVEAYYECVEDATSCEKARDCE